MVESGDILSPNIFMLQQVFNRLIIVCSYIMLG